MSSGNKILLLGRVVAVGFFNNLKEKRDPVIANTLIECIDSLKIENTGDEVDTQNEVIANLHETALWVIGSSDKVSLDQMQERVKINLGCDDTYMSIITGMLLLPEDTETERSIEQRQEDKMMSYLSEIHTLQLRTKLKESIAKWNRDAIYNGSTSNIAETVKSISEELDQFKYSDNPDSDITLVGKVDFNVTEEVKSALEEAVVKSSPDGLVKFPFKKINDMFGGGLEVGITHLAGALTHHYKTGWLTDMAVGIPLANKPRTDRDLIIRVSYEETINSDIITIYKKIYKHIHRRKLTKKEISTINIDEAVVIIQEFYKDRGFNFQLYFYDGNEANIYGLLSLLRLKIKEGWNIFAAIIDYPEIIAGRSPGKAEDVKITNTVQMIRTFSATNGFNSYIAHQLNTMAQGEAKTIKQGFTKLVCVGGWYMRCQSLHTKLDAESVQHIVKHNDGYDYLEISRGKHRGGEDTTDKDKFCILRFDDELGGLQYDAALDRLELNEQFGFNAYPAVTDLASLESNWG